MDGSEETVLSPTNGPEGDAVLEPGAKLGKYVIVRFIAGGGMGRVYQVRHQILQSNHAVKIILAAFAREKKFVSRFRREARIMAALDHPHIVRVTDFGDELGAPYYVMDYVEGPGGRPRTLEDELREAGVAGKPRGLPEGRVREIFLQI